jgi:hypothetical protein
MKSNNLKRCTFYDNVSDIVDLNSSGLLRLNYTFALAFGKTVSFWFKILSRVQKIEFQEFKQSPDQFCE